VKVSNNIHFIYRFILPFLCLLLALVSPAMAKTRVVIDASHGGSDIGIEAGSETEKDWNYKIAQALQKAFEDAGYEVVLIRKGDTSVPPEKRVEATNTSQAALAIILHADREWTGAQRGPFLVVEPPSRVEPGESAEIQKWGFTTLSQFRSSLRLARAVAQRLGVGTEISNLSDSRGTMGEATNAEGRILCVPHQSLRYLTLPSVVLVPLFLTSKSDIKKFSVGSSMTQFATQVVAGSSEFLQGAP